MIEDNKGGYLFKPAEQETAFQALKERFVGALNGDLNTSLAVTAVYDVLKAKTTDATKLAALADFDQVLSLNLIAAAEDIRKKEAEEAPAEAPAAEGEEAPAPKKRATRKKKTEEIDPSVD